jgi:pyruvate/2-oxoglutarate dehydrogenase complex dihydrolipoamide dehydrogenase (E3) component
MSIETYDLISLGSGEAGKILAWTFAQQGQRCAVIEERWYGGSCPNIACLPSKNIIHSANVVHDARSSSFGLLANTRTVDMTVRKRSMIHGHLATHEELFKASGAELIWGHGVFVGARTLEVTPIPSGEKKQITGKHVVVCTGSRALVDESIPGLTAANPLTHIELLELDRVPGHLITFGGGYVGLELSQAMRRLGAKVTIIEHNGKILKQEDDDVSEILREVLESEGIQILIGTSVVSVEGQSGSLVKVKIHEQGKESTIEGTHLFVGAGRIPNTQDIGLEEFGVKLTQNGHVKVDEHLRTTCPGVFAVGDCAGSPYFTHIGYDDFRIVNDILSGSVHPRVTTGRQVPSTLFASPEVAHVGLRESDAQKENIPYRLTKLPMKAFLRSRALGQTTGFAKALISNDNLILGFTAVGPNAGEMLPVVQLAMKHNLPYSAISGLIVTHPTMVEGLVGLFSATPKK